MIKKLTISNEQSAMSNQYPALSSQEKTDRSLLLSAHTTKPLRGFTLLLSVLISSVLLALGFAIFNIAVKDVILSSSGRESQFAFYAADSGIECALYWDSKQDAFSTSSPLTEIACGTGDLPSSTVPLTRVFEPVSQTYTTTFSFSLGNAISEACSNVEVKRTENPTRTTVVSSGHNTCVTTNPRRIERAIRVQF